MGEPGSVLPGDRLESPYWSVAELGSHPSGDKLQGIDATQVKPLLKVLEKASPKSEGLSREGQPCQQLGPGLGCVLSSLPFLPSLSGVIAWMLILHLATAGRRVGM